MVLVGPEATHGSCLKGEGVLSKVLEVFWWSGG